MDLDLGSIFTNTLETVRGGFNDKYISEIEKEKIKLQSYKPAPQPTSPQSPTQSGFNYQTFAIIAVVGIIAIFAVREVM